MTNDEIQQVAHSLTEALQSFGGSTYYPWNGAEQTIEEAFRSLVSQAYEEAAKIADDQRTEAAAISDWNAVVDCEEIATAIRALKDSLVLEPVSS
jgi:hypothetical protein